MKFLIGEVVSSFKIHGQLSAIIKEHTGVREQFVHFWKVWKSILDVRTDTLHIAATYAYVCHVEICIL
jgi:hypothetical protein